MWLRGIWYFAFALRLSFFFGFFSFFSCARERALASFRNTYFSLFLFPLQDQCQSRPALRAFHSLADCLHFFALLCFLPSVLRACFVALFLQFRLRFAPASARDETTWRGRAERAPPSNRRAERGRGKSFLIVWRKVFPRQNFWESSFLFLVLRTDRPSAPPSQCVYRTLSHRAAEKCVRDDS